MNYTLNQLRVFLKIAQEKSVTKAAEKLHLTQPAVSIQLKNFQDQFEIPLTEVVGRKIYITDFGKEIAEAADAILEQVNAINYKTMAYKGQLTGKLKISVVSTGKYVMPFFLAQFMKEHPGIELVMDVTNKNRVVRSLDRNEVDFSLVSILPLTPKVEKLDLIENKLYLVGNKPRILEKPMQANGEFKKLPFIFREEGSGTRQTMESFISQNNISVLKKMELTSNEAVKQAVLAGLGYSIMPIIGIKNELDNESLHIIPVEGLPITTTWSLIWLKEKKHSPAATSLLEFLKQKKEQIAKEHFNFYKNY
jgi:DNA-binding transcriptional LysR family regulator